MSGTLGGENHHARFNLAWVVVALPSGVVSSLELQPELFLPKIREKIGGAAAQARVAGDIQQGQGADEYKQESSLVQQTSLALGRGSELRP